VNLNFLVRDKLFWYSKFYN